MEPGETRYADDVLSQKNHFATSNGVLLFLIVTASGRMSEQYVYNRSFRGILNNEFNQ